MWSKNGRPVSAVAEPHPSKVVDHLGGRQAVADPGPGQGEGLGERAYHGHVGVPGYEPRGRLPAELDVGLVDDDERVPAGSERLDDLDWLCVPGGVVRRADEDDRGLRGKGLGDVARRDGPRFV